MGSRLVYWTSSNHQGYILYTIGGKQAALTLCHLSEGSEESANGKRKGTWVGDWGEGNKKRDQNIKPRLEPARQKAAGALLSDTYLSRAPGARLGTWGAAGC